MSPGAPFGARLAAGDSTKGLEASFAARLGLGPSTWNMAKTGARPIGDRLARQIESGAGVPAGWLDEVREPEGLQPAEERFLAMALKAWRGTDADGRKRLRALARELSTA